MISANVGRRLTIGELIAFREIAADKREDYSIVTPEFMSLWEARAKFIKDLREKRKALEPKPPAPPPIASAPEPPPPPQIPEAPATPEPAEPIRVLSPLDALRARCLDCKGYAPSAVASCGDPKCDHYPFRMGRGVGRKGILKAIRKHCLWCCLDQPLEVRLCPARGCPSWPYRLGHRPRGIESAGEQEQTPCPTSQLVPTAADSARPPA